jgi:hypothetical protein
MGKAYKQSDAPEGAFSQRLGYQEPEKPHPEAPTPRAALKGDIANQAYRDRIIEKDN